MLDRFNGDETFFISDETLSFSLLVISVKLLIFNVETLLETPLRVETGLRPVSMRVPRTFNMMLHQKKGDRQGRRTRYGEVWRSPYLDLATNGCNSS